MGRPRKPKLQEAVMQLVVELREELDRQGRATFEPSRSALEASLADLAQRVRRLERRIDRMELRGSGGRAAPTPCSHEGCEAPTMARGLCSRHYQQMRYRAKREG